MKKLNKWNKKTQNILFFCSEGEIRRKIVVIKKNFVTGQKRRHANENY